MKTEGLKDLVARELRFSLFQVRGDTLFCVDALEQQLLQFALDRQALAESCLEAGLHRPFDSADRAAGLLRGRELPRVFQHGIEKALPRQSFLVPDLGDET